MLDKLFLSHLKYRILLQQTIFLLCKRKVPRKCIARSWEIYCKHVPSSITTAKGNIRFNNYDFNIEDKEDMDNHTKKKIENTKL